MSSPYVITLTLLEESVLNARARSSTAAHRDVIRARIVLAAAQGAANTEIAAEVITRGIAETISAVTVRRWLAADAIKPWQHRSGIFPRDPDFGTKAARVLDLYARRWEGQPLGPDDYVISADEKSQLQALHRRHRGQGLGCTGWWCRVSASTWAIRSAVAFIWAANSSESGSGTGAEIRRDCSSALLSSSHRTRATIPIASSCARGQEKEEHHVEETVCHRRCSGSRVCSTRRGGMGRTAVVRPQFN